MDKLLTTDDVAKRLHVHQNTVIRYIREGKITAVKIGNAYRIRESVVAALTGHVEPAAATAKIISVSNQKGGVAKTTTAVNLATSLAQAGKRTLLVDLDPQGGCGVCLGIDTSALQRTIYDVLVKPTVNIRHVVMRTTFGFDLVPSNIDLAGAEVELRQVLAQESVLKRQLQPLANEYDYIVLDTPPNLGILTINALTAARYVLIPIACEYMALRWFSMLLSTIEDIQGVTNPHLRILGVLVTKYDTGTVDSREIYEYIGQVCAREGIKVFNQVVKDSVRIREAPKLGTPLVLLHPSHEGAKAYAYVTEEILHG